MIVLWQVNERPEEEVDVMEGWKTEERKEGGRSDELQKALVAFINSLFSLPCECIDSSSGLVHICGEGRRLYFVSGPEPRWWNAIPSLYCCVCVAARLWRLSWKSARLRVMCVFVRDPAWTREGVVHLCVSEFACVFVFEFRLPAATLMQNSVTFPRISTTKSEHFHDLKMFLLWSLQGSAVWFPYRWRRAAENH